MKIFSIETSCDETAAAILNFDKKGNFKILAEEVSSQIKLHSEWGGVVPNLAAREHSKNILPVINKTFKKSNLKKEDIDLFCVTQGPGLIPALLIGTNVAKTLSYFYKKPLLGVHHIEGHIYSNFIENNSGNLYKFKFPILNLVISGGHTQLILMKDHLNYEVVGETQDDAVGEAFDKVAKMMGLGYPGGPIISVQANQAEKLITKGKIEEKFLNIDFPRPMLNSKDLNFSFSGLKTAVLYFYQKLEKENLSEEELGLWKKFVSKAFQDAVVDVLTKKTIKAIEKHQPKSVLSSGGVSANSKILENIKKQLKEQFPEIVFSAPEKKYCGDNAVMIAVAGIARYLYGNKKELESNWKKLEAESSLKIFF